MVSMILLVPEARLIEWTAPDIEVRLGRTVATLVFVHEADGDEARTIVEVDGRRHGSLVAFDSTTPRVRVARAGPPLSTEERSYFEDEGFHALRALANLLAETAAGRPY